MRLVDWELVYQQLARTYGWTPDMVGNLTISQILLYLLGKDGKPRNTKTGSDFKKIMLKRRKLLQDAHKKYNGSVPEKVCQEIFKQTEI